MRKEIPILFSTVMVQAIIAGNKTMTRRIIKHQPKIDEQTGDVYLPSFNEVVPIEEWKKTQIELCKYQIGDLLWVRETWAEWCSGSSSYKVVPMYKASENFDEIKWKPSIHMKKKYARIWLEVTNLKVERVQDITEEDAIAEGIVMNNKPHHGWYWMEDIYSTDSAIYAYECLWSKINGKESWEENPFVWVPSFKVLSTTGKP